MHVLHKFTKFLTYFLLIAPYMLKYIICCSYPNGDVFSGYFVEGKRQGHGVLKQGHLTSFLASIYAGEWANNKRNGYGVLDEITTG